jgi:low temperature requirement protein LtrA
MAKIAELLGGVHAIDDTHRVTTFELFFDLVFVFAVTQVTAFMGHEHNAIGLVLGLLILALLWWAWCAFAWLGQQAQADVGVVKVAMTVAMVAIFIVALAIPEAWHDAPGGLNGPMALVAAYIVVKFSHVAGYWIAAGQDSQLRRQLVLSLAPWALGSSLLAAGSIMGGSAQTVMWTLGLMSDIGGTYLASRSRFGQWRFHSPGHWAERHGLIVILALGESIVAIGVGASNHPVSAPLVTGAVFGVLISVALWWLHFRVFAPGVEEQLQRQQDLDRVKLARDGYTILHFPVIAGIVVAALGVEDAMAHVAELEPFGAFSAGALLTGFSFYLLGHVVVWRRATGRWHLPRASLAVAVLALWPAVAAVPPLLALATAVAVLGALIAWERTHARQLRQRAIHDRDHTVAAAPLREIPPHPFLPCVVYRDSIGSHRNSMEG